MRIAIVIAVAAGLGGCSSLADVPAYKSANIVASDYCSIAEKVSWSPKDTPATIHGIRRENAKYDRKCRKSDG